MKKIIAFLLFTIFMAYNTYAQEPENSNIKVTILERITNNQNDHNAPQEIRAVKQETQGSKIITVEGSTWYNNCHVDTIRIENNLRIVAFAKDCFSITSDTKGKVPEPKDTSLRVDLGVFTMKSTSYNYRLALLGLLSNKTLTLQMKNDKLVNLDIIN